MKDDNHPLPMNVIVSVVRDFALRRGMETILNPSSLMKTISRSAEVASLAVDIRPTEEKFDSSCVTSMIVEFSSILFSELPGTVNEPPPQLKLQSILSSQQRRAAIASTWLPKSMCSDLNLFLIGPAGASESDLWQELAAELERNEQVCRKLVWLPPGNESEFLSSAELFCKRTFLSWPWQSSVATPRSAQLDPIAAMLDDNNLVAKWLTLIESSDDDCGELTEKLIETFMIESNDVS